MSREYRPYTPEQPYLLPACPQDWLPEDDVAYQVRDVVGELDLAAFHAAQVRKDPRGGRPLDPRMMIGILLYAWAHRVYSSRRIAALCCRDLGARYLAAGYLPNFRTVSDFQLEHGEALADLFVQSVKLCRKAGMVSLVHVATDGSKIEANASKHKAMSYERMELTEEQIRREIEALQRRAREEDTEEDTLFGKDNVGPDIPAELARRESRLIKIRKAREELEAEARAAAEAKQAERAAKEEEAAEHGRRLGGKKPIPPEEAKPKEKAQRNFTDPESRIMKAGNGSYIQGYNAQASVDGDNQVVVACDVTNMAADAPHFIGMSDQIVSNTGEAPENHLADAGYLSEENAAHEAGPDSRNVISVGREKKAAGEPDKLPSPDIADEQLSATERMRRYLATPEGKAEYARRKSIVEPTFGQIKGCPGSPGFRHFLRRGLRKAWQEWRWQCATHNLLKYMRHQSKHDCACAAAG
jgi:transposase